jgi:hypothetical protein
MLCQLSYDPLTSVDTEILKIKNISYKSYFVRSTETHTIRGDSISTMDPN